MATCKDRIYNITPPTKVLPGISPRSPRVFQDRVETLSTGLLWDSFPLWYYIGIFWLWDKNGSQTLVRGSCKDSVSFISHTWLIPLWKEGRRLIGLDQGGTWSWQEYRGESSPSVGLLGGGFGGCERVAAGRFTAPLKQQGPQAVAASGSTLSWAGTITPFSPIPVLMCLLILVCQSEYKPAVSLSYMSSAWQQHCTWCFTWCEAHRETSFWLKININVNW